MPLDFYEVERDLFSSLVPLDFYKVERIFVCPLAFIKSNEICFQAYTSRLFQSRLSFVFKGLPFDFYKSNECIFFKLFKRDLSSSFLTLDFYEAVQDFLSSLCRSTFTKPSEICLQAFAARILLLRHGFSCQAIFSEPQIIRPTVSKTRNNQLSTRNF